MAIGKVLGEPNTVLPKKNCWSCTFLRVFAVTCLKGGCGRLPPKSALAA